MSPGPGARVVVLLGRGGSLSPLEIAAAAEGLTDITFMLDTRDAKEDAGGLHAVAANLAPTVALDDLQPPGTRLDWRHGTGGATSLVWLAADDHDILRSNLVRAAEFLTDHFEFTDEKGTAMRDISWLEQVSEGFLPGGRVPDGAVE